MFIFAQNFAVKQIRDVDFKNDNSFLKIQPKDIKTRHFWSATKVFLFLHEILQIGK